MTRNLELRDTWKHVDMGLTKFVATVCCAILAALLILPLSVHVAAAQDSSSSVLPVPQSSFRVTWNQNRLSLWAQDAPLDAILREISRQTGIVVNNMQLLGTSFTGQFSDLSLGAALQKILWQQDYLIQGDLSLQHGPPPVLLWVCDRHATACIKPELSSKSWAALAAAARKHPPQRHASITRRDNDQPEPDYSTPDADLDYSQPADSADTFSEADEAAEQADPKKKLADFTKALNSFDTDALQKWVKDGDPVLQSSAFEAIALLDRDAAVSALLAAMQADRPDVRLQALQLLDQYKQADQETVLSALHEAIKDNDPTVRVVAVQALARRGGVDAMRYLREAFLDPDPSVRVMVISSPTSDGADRSLLYQALSDSDPMVRDSAAQLLQQPDANGAANF